MTASFFSRLEERAREADSLLCVGLDPHPALAGEGAAAAEEFCRRIIESTCDVAAAFKPNAAFFEAAGPDGVAALQRVVGAVPDGIPVLLDAKRGDIASTAAAYATAVFDVIGADAVTASPYLGRDALEPLLSHPEGAVFVLARTSNPGAAGLQDAVLATGETVAERVVGLFGDTVGYVVGATAPEPLRRIREIAPGCWILAPGVGPQGADLEAAVAAGIRDDGLGLLIPASRAIAGAPDPGAAARTLRDRINAARRVAAPHHTDPIGRLASALHDAGCIRFGKFTLKSGATSPVYVDLRRLAGHPGVLRLVARMMAEVLATLEFDHLAPLPYAALPIGTAIALQTGASMVYPRQRPKEHGTESTVEGVFASGDRVVIVDDVASDGASKLEARSVLAGVGLEATDVVVLVDREGRAAADLAAAGLRLHAVTTLGAIVERLGAAGTIDETTLTDVLRWLRG